MVVIVLWAAQALTGCGGGGSAEARSPAQGAQAPQPGSAVVPSRPADIAPPRHGLHGHFRGTAAVGDDSHRYHAEALVTVDGAVRLYVGGPFDVHVFGSGAGVTAEFLDPAESMLFLGSVALHGDHGLGDGVVIGQSCDGADGGRFCGEPAMAELRVERSPIAEGFADLAAEVRIRTSEGEEVWLLDMRRWSVYYDLPGTHPSGGGADHVPGVAPFHGSPVGTYAEVLARFAQADDVIITIDDHGRLFFQSPASGCTGNGALQGHGNGRFYVFDVDLLIESCNASHASLNGDFEGLATETQGGYWSYDNWLLMFLATPEASGPRTAITMLAPAIEAP